MESWNNLARQSTLRRIRRDSAPDLTVNLYLNSYFAVSASSQLRGSAGSKERCSDSLTITEPA